MEKVPILNLDSFKVIKKLGKGAFGTVYLVDNIRENKKYAAKETQESVDDKEDHYSSFYKEIISYSRVDNQAIVHLFGYSPNNFNSQPYPTMIIDYMINGSLDKIMDKQRHSLAPTEFTSTKRYIILLGVAIGMKYLHSKGIIHRDLKPGNILLDENFYPKICDLGCSTVSDKKLTEIRMKSEEGTPMYMAPEIFVNESFSYKIDIYAYSFVAYELITGKLPFDDCKNTYQLIDNIQKGMRPDTSTIGDENTKKFLEKCWSNNPLERPSFSEIVSILMTKQLRKEFDYIDEEEINAYLDMFDEKLLQKEFFDSIDIKKFADQGNIELMLFYGLMLKRGIGVTSNKNESAKYFKKAADLGSTEGMLLYAITIANGNESQKKEAAHYFKMAADKGDMNALVEYGVMNFYGNGIKMNKKEAAKCYKIAADNGNSEGMIKYAMMIDQGKFIKMNKKEAARYYQMAIDKGHIGAMYIYGNMLLNGDGVPVDQRKGIFYLKMAADKNVPEAMLNYGMRLITGNGIQVNIAEGIRYVKGSAERGYQKAILVCDDLKKAGLFF